VLPVPTDLCGADKTAETTDDSSKGK